MGDWNRLYDACKDATGTEINDIYDAHIVVEELDDKNRRLARLNKDLIELVELVYKSFGGGQVVTFSDSDILRFKEVYKKATK